MQYGAHENKNFIVLLKDRDPGHRRHLQLRIVVGVFAWKKCYNKASGERSKRLKKEREGAGIIT
jgi:hypothetical protein